MVFVKIKTSSSAYVFVKDLNETTKNYQLKLDKRNINNVELPPCFVNLCEKKTRCLDKRIHSTVMKLAEWWMGFVCVEWSGEQTSNLLWSVFTLVTVDAMFHGTKWRQKNTDRLHKANCRNMLNRPYQDTMQCQKAGGQLIKLLVSDLHSSSRLNLCCETGKSFILVFYLFLKQGKFS